MHAHAPQWPSRQENGASRPAASSTSSSLAVRGQETVWVWPSSSTTAVAGASSPLSSTLTAANGSDSSDLNTSMCTCWAGTFSAARASRAACMNGPGPQMNTGRSV
ncbi:Uncharacterised protein [Mycobacterium tuberculosis]|nr:Uncharacterised protein [Mycobacterium tuberculosis]